MSTNHPISGKVKTSVECDQMPKMFAQYLAIYNNVNWPESTLNFPKLVQKFAKY